MHLRRELGCLTDADGWTTRAEKEEAEGLAVLLGV